MFYIIIQSNLLIVYLQVLSHSIPKQRQPFDSSSIAILLAFLRSREMSIMRPMLPWTVPDQGDHVKNKNLVYVYIIDIQ